MTLAITLYHNSETAHISFGYHVIHILRRYACDMVNAQDEDSPEAKEHFPNLCYHHDGQGYYIGEFLESMDWDVENNIWIGSVKGLYEELQKVSDHMIRTNYEGTAKEVLAKLLQLFHDVEFDMENVHHSFIIFS